MSEKSVNNEKYWDDVSIDQDQDQDRDDDGAPET